MNPRYRVIKETVELEKGAILVIPKDDCYENGDYNYVCPDKSKYKFDDQNELVYSAKTVEGQPEWFEEVKVLWLTVKEWKKIKKFLKLKK